MEEQLFNKEYYDYIKHFFSEKDGLFSKLEELHKKKTEIISLTNENGGLKEPLIITISGTPRAGKTTCIDNLFEFLKKTNLKTICLEEPAGLVYQTLKTKEEKKELLKDRVGFVNRQFELGKEYINNNLENNDIILCDRGIIDPFFWYDMYYNQGLISASDYKKFLLKLKEVSNYNNLFYALYASCEESMRRDYLSSLSIEPRTTMNGDNVQCFNDSIIRMMPIIDREIKSTSFIDTTSIEKIEPSIMIANNVLDNVKKLYLGRKK